MKFVANCSNERLFDTIGQVELDNPLFTCFVASMGDAHLIAENECVSVFLTCHGFFPPK